jgi:hypothetical protein
MNEKNELLPCPFCGADAAIQEHEPHAHSVILKSMLPGLPDHPGSFTIECMGAGCNTGLIADTRAEVVAMWNRRAPRQAPDYSPLFARIDEAVENYVRHGAACEFEGQPMIYAATLLEIGNLLGEVAPNKSTAQPLQQEGGKDAPVAFLASPTALSGQEVYLERSHAEASAMISRANGFDTVVTPLFTAPQPSDKLQQASTAQAEPAIRLSPNKVSIPLKIESAGATDACTNCNGFGRDSSEDHYGEDCPVCHGAGSVPVVATPASDVSAAQWISVKDRLPDDNQVVMICGPLPPDVSAHTPRKGWRTLVTLKGDNFLDANGCTRNSATHWMPVPESFYDAAPVAQADGGA